MANNLHKFLYSFEKTIRSCLILKHTKFQIHIFENGCVTGGGGFLTKNGCYQMENASMA